MTAPNDDDPEKPFERMHWTGFAEWIDDTYCYDPEREPDDERVVDVDDEDEERER